MGELGRDPADLLGRDPGLLGHRIGAVLVIEKALRQQLEHRPRPAPVGQRAGTG